MNAINGNHHQIEPTSSTIPDPMEEVVSMETRPTTAPRLSRPPCEHQPHPEGLSMTPLVSSTLIKRKQKYIIIYHKNKSHVAKHINSHRYTACAGLKTPH